MLKIVFVFVGSFKAAFPQGFHKLNWLVFFHLLRLLLGGIISKNNTAYHFLYVEDTEETYFFLLGVSQCYKQACKL